MGGSVIDHPPEKIGVAMQSCDHFRTGFLTDFWYQSSGLRRSPGNRPFSGHAGAAAPSHRACVEAARSRVRLSERALSLKQRASDHPARLNECASEIALDCASGRSSLRAATLNGDGYGLKQSARRADGRAEQNRATVVADPDTGEILPT